jgi:hypothetical protein
VAIGFAFGEGSLYALDWQKGSSNTRGTFRVGRAPLGTFDGDLSIAGLAAFVIDMRRAEGPAARGCNRLSERTASEASSEGRARVLSAMLPRAPSTP